MIVSPRGTIRIGCAPRLLAALIALLVLPPPAQAVRARDPGLQARKKQYLDGLFAAKPHLATFMGDHRFDDRLPDLSPAVLSARDKALVEQLAWVTAYRQRAAAEPAAFPLDDRIDADILADGIGLELLYLREIRDWAWDPRLYDSFPCYDPREIVGGRLSDIIHGDFAPEAARRKSVVAQLKALPKFLSQEKAALLAGSPRFASKEYAAQAVKANRGRIEFFQTEVREFLGADVAGQQALGGAVNALGDYQRFLESELTPRASGDWRLGAALYARKFPLALQTGMTPEQALARAEKDFRQSKEQLLAVALRLHDQLWPREPRLVGARKPPLAAEAGAVIRRVKDELSRQHPRADELVAAHGRNLDRLREFIEQHDLLSLPPKETLVVAPMPGFKRGSTAAEYLAPGLLEGRKDFRATYYVDPIDPSWPPERVESYLRGQNDYGVELTAAHEAYPGHHTQISYARSDLNPLRVTLWNPAMVEGWAVYGTSLLVQLGYGGERALGYQFEDLRGHMVVAANTILDVKLQGGTMTDEEAVRFMVEEGFQEQAVAEKKLLRAKLDSTQLAQYFLGYSEIAELEKEERVRVGAYFRQRAFDEAVIGHGSIAVRHIRAYLQTPATLPAGAPGSPPPTR